MDSALTPFEICAVRHLLGGAFGRMLGESPHVLFSLCDLRKKNCQNGISSGVGRQDLKFLLCYLSEGRKLLLNTRNNSGGLAIGRHKFPDHMERFKTVGKLLPSGQLGWARMSVASPSQIGRKSLEDLYVTRHGRKSVASHS